MDKIWIGALMAASLCGVGGAAPVRAATADHESLVYSGSFAGVKVLALTAGVDLRQDGYAVDVDFHTIGTLDFLSHSQIRSLADGAWQRGRALPSRYLSNGVLRGKTHAVEILYPDGQPHVAVFDSEPDLEREPVPEAMQHDTMDGLSAMATLLENVANTGICDGEVTMFDGRILARLDAQNGGQDVLPAKTGSLYHGPALRCEITTTPLAGFPKGSEPGDSQRRPRHSSAWFARVHEGGPYVPVLIEIELRIVGHMTLKLVSAPG